MDAFDDGEKIGIRKIRLVRLGLQSFAVVGTFANADELLTAWRLASHGQLRCRFEIEYVDEHVVTCEYRSPRARARRVSLAAHVRATFRKMGKRIGLAQAPGLPRDGYGMQFWLRSRAWPFGADFLERYES
jgi:hypothetical protein